MRRDIHGGQYAGGIAGVDAGFLDVLHDAGDDNVFAIGERIHVHFDRVFKEVVDEDGPVLRVLDRLFHVADDRFFIVGDDHGAPAQNVRRPHQDRIAYALGTFDCFFERGCHRARRLGDFQFVEQLAEAFAVFAQVDRFG